MSGFALSKHALSRAVDMALDPDEIRLTLERPRVEFWSDRTQSWMFTRGRLTACLKQADADVWTVTTFLWAKPSGWAADAEFAPIPGRSTSDHTGARAVVRAMKRKRK